MLSIADSLTEDPRECSEDLDGYCNEISDDPDEKVEVQTESVVNYRKNGTKSGASLKQHVE